MRVTVLVAIFSLSNMLATLSLPFTLKFKRVHITEAIKKSKFYFAVKMPVHLMFIYLLLYSKTLYLIFINFTCLYLYKHVPTFVRMFRNILICLK